MAWVGGRHCPGRLHIGPWPRRRGLQSDSPYWRSAVFLTDLYRTAFDQLGPAGSSALAPKRKSPAGAERSDPGSRYSLCAPTALVRELYSQIDNAFEWVLALLLNVHALWVALLWRQSSFQARLL